MLLSSKAMVLLLQANCRFTTVVYVSGLKTLRYLPTYLPMHMFLKVSKVLKHSWQMAVFALVPADDARVFLHTVLLHLHFSLNAVS